ncbi:MAG TPA: DNA-binding domain-containing protein [Nannocystaceae bacterium]|nr:DNA-binding domain-containing protein [Nannocystaceae bacterium]
MSTLAEQQALFWRAITWPTGVADFLRHADDATRAAFAATFDETATFARSDRVGVYADAYFFRLLGVLRDHFGLVAWLCGAARFNDLVTDYVLAHPSIDPDVRRYGERFPAFVAAHAEVERIPGLAEIAAIEWAMVHALDCVQSPPLAASTVQAVPPEQWVELRLRAVQSVALLPTRLPFAELWQRHDREPSPSEAPALVLPHHVLVWRHDLAPMHRVPDPAESAALARMIAGTTFGELCSDHDAVTLVGWFSRWLDDGVLASGDAT